MNKLIILIFAVSLLAFVSADNVNDIPTYALNTNVTLEHSIRLNGAPVNASCNITIYNQRRIAFVSYAPMKYVLTNQTYTFVLFPQNLSDKGTYAYDVTCLSPNGNKTESFLFEITEDGTQPTLEEGLAYFFLLFVGIGLFIFCVWGIIRINKINFNSPEAELVKLDKKKYLKMFLFAMGYLLVVWCVYASWHLAGLYINNRTIWNFFYFVNVLLLKLIWPFAVIWGVVTFVVYIRDLRLQDKVKRGVFIDANK